MSAKANEAVKIKNARTRRDCEKFLISDYLYLNSILLSTSTAIGVWPSAARLGDHPGFRFTDNNSRGWPYCQWVISYEGKNDQKLIEGIKTNTAIIERFEVARLAV